MNRRPVHYRILMDALELASSPPACPLVSMVRRHRRMAWLGCRDPDIRFRDFHNHVVHVTDGYWGGAPRLAHRWYERMVTAAAGGDWRLAVRACGTMVHYVTDPLHPLHTAQCDRSRRDQLTIKSIGWRNYDRWRDEWIASAGRVVCALSSEPVWLGEAVLHGARRAHRHYGTLLHDIDITQTTTDLDAPFGRRFADAHVEMVGVAVTLVAAILERAARDVTRHQSRKRRFRWTLPSVLDAWRQPFDAWADYRHQVKLRRFSTQPDQWPEVDLVRRVIEVHQSEHRWCRQRPRPTDSVNLFKLTPNPSQNDRPMIAGRIGAANIDARAA